MAMLPLTVILVLHLMLVLLWVSHPRIPVDLGAAQRQFTLTWLPALKPRAPQSAVRVVRPQAAPASSARRLAPPIATEAISDQPEMPQPVSAPDAIGVSQMIASAKLQAGAIDRELRDGKAAPLTGAPDLPFNRFRSALEGAYIDRSKATVTDSYTQPDGVIVYRFRRGGKVWCRQSGGGGPSMIERSDGAKLGGAGSAGGAGTAGSIACPSGADGWSRL